MSATTSFLQRIVTAVGPAGASAGPAALAGAGPVALGRFLRRRWLPSLRRTVMVARAAEDEELEGQQPEESPSSAPPSVQTLRRAPLRRSESAPADDAASEAAGVPEPGTTAPVAQFARAESAARPAARRAPGDPPASPVAAVAAPREGAEATVNAPLSAGQAPQPDALSAPVAREFEVWRPPGPARSEPSPERASQRAIAPLSGAAPASVAQRAAEIASAAPALAAPPAAAEAPASFTAPARPGVPPESSVVFPVPGPVAAVEGPSPERRAAGEPTHAFVPTERLRVGFDAGPARALPETRDEVLAAEPLVQIGSIEIVIEAAPEPKAAASAPAAAPDFSSRYYLRGL